ncbi:MAG: OsmC family protein [Pseudoxanthomonas sp.]
MHPHQKAAVFASLAFAALCVATVLTPQAGAQAAAAGPDAPQASLRDHLLRKKAAITQSAQQDIAPLQIHGKVTAESRSGVRRLRIGQGGTFQYISDSGRDYAGYNLGAGSWESLIGTLASAVADEYLVQAAAKGIALDSLDVVFNSLPDDPSVAKTHAVRYPRNLGYIAYITSPASDAQLEALRRAVEASSSAINLVTQHQQVDHVKVEYVQTPQQRQAGLPPGLRDFISEEKRPAVLKRQAPSRTPQTPEILTARTHVEPHTGLRFTSLGTDGYHKQLHDSAPNLLGYGVAPTVEEHLLGVTGTCLTHIFEVQAATRNVLLDSLELTVDGTLTPRFGKQVRGPSRYQDIRYTVRIESPASAQEVDGLRAAVEKSCPLYNLIKDEQPVDGRIVRGPYVDKAA